MKRLLALSVAVVLGGALAAPPLAAAPVAAAAVREIPPLNEGEEPTIITRHQIRTRDGTLAYEARIGRLAIRNDQTGEIVGYLGFQAYVVAPKAGQRPRPLLFAWNGGANSPAMLLQSRLLGPRLLQGDAMVDNPDTLLRASDLVFYDPINTGYSRPTKPEYTQQFLTVLGDFAVTTEFIRAYRTRYAAEDQPLFLLGESYGTWRAAGVLDTMAKRHQPIAGIVMISASGGLGSTESSPSRTRAMYVEARNAAALALGKLGPDLQKDPEATRRAALEWSQTVYMPALAKGPEVLSPAERETIAAQLERYTGVPAGSVDRTTLSMSNLAFRQSLFPGDKSRELNMYDLRRFGPFASSQSPAIGRYLRDDLGYHTTLAFTPVEDGYMPRPGPDRRDNFSLWTYDYFPGAQQIYIDNVKRGEGPPRALPWVRDGMTADPGVRLFIATGRYDSLNSCAANARSAAGLAPAVGARITTKCYEGGHMIYESSEAVRRELSDDLAGFVRSAANGAR